MTKLLSLIHGMVWGAPALILILGIGIYLSVQLHFVQLTLLPEAIVQFWKKLRPHKKANGSASSFRALCTALAATVGTGNLVGVAGAISLGGPGAVFWMWISGFLGMATKYAEVTLALRYRVRTETGFAGGPMYVISQGLGNRFRPLATTYCILGLLASFGVGNAAQINAVTCGIHSLCGGEEKRNSLLVGILLALLIGRMLLGGAKRIGAAAERLVPFAAAAYMVLCLGVLLRFYRRLPMAFESIFLGAFSPRAVTGGMLGSAFQAMRVGCSRGVFTNEAGMGTAAIAHACAQVDHPAQQGLMGIMEVFLDTIVICTLTALVILVSGVPIPYGMDTGSELTIASFSVVYGKAAGMILTAALTLFAIASVLGWGFYGASCAQFLFGAKAWRPFAWAQIMTIVVSSVLDTASVWQFSELMNGLMTIPNLLTLAVLAPEAGRLTKEYRKTGKRAGGGNYADFHQRKPL